VSRFYCPSGHFDNSNNALQTEAFPQSVTNNHLPITHCEDKQPLQAGTMGREMQDEVPQR
jgi:hypothetical protein